MKNVDLVIIGGGPAGIGAALSAYENGIRDIVILERSDKAGGILPQCIHNGFGLHYFKEELTGAEYANRLLKKINKTNINIMLDTMVIDIDSKKIVTATSSKNGVVKYNAKAIVLAMGCRERTRGAISIPGTRPAGILTAGAAQRFVNMEGYMPGKEIVILGSGDIGLIMARRLKLEGANVHAVCEIMKTSSGLQRNISQCLNDFDIPLLLSHTVTEVFGENRVAGVNIARVDENLLPIKSTEKYIECDTLLLSVGLIPENELSESAGVTINKKTSGCITNKFMQTNIGGIFGCGNVVHVHDLVDYVTAEATEAGKNAANYILGHRITGNGYKFVEKKVEEETILTSSEKRLTCIVCPIGCSLTVTFDEENDISKITKISGNRCKKGIAYATEEFTAPKRILTSTIKVRINDRIIFAPVKTSIAIPKELLLDVMGEIKKICIDIDTDTSSNNPLSVGTVLVENILSTNANLVLTDDINL